ncbi:hypothetical protein HanIR_Chr14g0672381 [Helianthus annuus]|nr:hypothetical protein HanIR_Chr14g0672381 [Helianthus annuus]
MRISFIVANIDSFHFLINPHAPHALFVTHVDIIPICCFIRSSNIISLYLIFAFINHGYCKTLTL